MNDITDSFIDIFNNDNFINNNDNNDELDETNGFSILKNYSDELVSKNYVTNPAIAREKKIKKMILILLSPEKSVVLTGKAGIGKTAIVEGLSYKIKNKDVPNALLNSKVYKINTSSLLGTYEHDGISESKLQLLINEIINSLIIVWYNEWKW